jgi:hypothetical protein
LSGNDLDSAEASVRAPVRAPEAELCPELAKIQAAWPDLPGPIKAAILALVGSSTKTGR